VQFVGSGGRTVPTHTMQAHTCDLDCLLRTAGMLIRSVALYLQALITGEQNQVRSSVGTVKLHRLEV
jgi:hypothetical protein